jgi:hypothetical protein
VFINNKKLNHEYHITYLGILIDSNLSWKPQVNNIAKQIKRSIGIMSKLRYFVSFNILVNGLNVWGNTYPSTLNPLYILQKKAVQIITF